MSIYIPLLGNLAPRIASKNPRFSMESQFQSIQKSRWFTPQMLKSDLNTFEYLFESLRVHDIRVYSEYYDGKVYHYHDERDNEADAIIVMPDGRWGMFEIKVGFNQVDKAAGELLSLKIKFETETKSSPEFLCVICGMANMAFRRPDGVYVVPITALGI